VDCAMVDSINQIAHLMNIRTVAEFVESEGIFYKIKDLGVDYAQGYWIEKPQPLETLTQWGKIVRARSHCRYQIKIDQRGINGHLRNDARA
jgi:EAL domain-containing protein (putative c-di-GMP-specific phosphodiesterase class I)